jgi:imidazolonepropionase-like amidohydrolase
MAKKKVFLVPTENSRSYMETYARLAGYAEDERDWIDYYMDNMEGRLERAIAKGVSIVAGSDNYTDIGVSAGQSSTDMLRAYIEAGMKPLDILQSATFLAAKSLNREQSIGRLSPGAFADIIAVRGGLEQDFLATMDRLVFVMKDGEIYLDRRE